MFWWETKTHAVVRQLLIRPETGGHGVLALRRGFLLLSRVLPTSRVFTSGYVNTETILHVFNAKQRSLLNLKQSL